VQTINKAQRMFKVAYDNFLGAGGNAATPGSGNAALADILSEIDGLQDPTITAVWVYNNDADKPPPDMINNRGALTMDLRGKLFNVMRPLTFKMKDVHLKVDGKMQSLTHLAGGTDNGSDDQKVGVMEPDWNEAKNTLHVQVSKNSPDEGHWGVGVT